MLNLDKAFRIFLNWQTHNPMYMELFIKKFYNWTSCIRKLPQEERSDTIYPRLAIIDNKEELLTALLEEFRQEGVEELIIYLLEHDNRYENTDTFDNYKTYKPYPSYFIQFAYLLLFIFPKRSRRLFEAFWEHQFKINPGIDELYARGYIEPFVEAGITNREEIEGLLIHKWNKWQEGNEDTYPVPPGLIIGYYGVDEWEKLEKQLESNWYTQHGRHPRKNIYFDARLYG